MTFKYGKSKRKPNKKPKRYVLWKIIEYLAVSCVCVCVPLAFCAGTFGSVGCVDDGIYAGRCLNRTSDRTSVTENYLQLNVAIFVIVGVIRPSYTLPTKSSSLSVILRIYCLHWPPGWWPSCARTDIIKLSRCEWAWSAIWQAKGVEQMKWPRILEWNDMECGRTMHFTSLVNDFYAVDIGDISNANFAISRLLLFRRINSFYMFILRPQSPSWAIVELCENQTLIHRCDLHHSLIVDQLIP